MNLLTPDEIKKAAAVAELRMNAQQSPPRRFTALEVDLLAAQAGDRARLRAKQQNDQVAAKLLDTLPLSDAMIDLLVKQETEGSRFRTRQCNELYDLTQAHQEAEQALRSTQAAEREKLHEET